MASRACCWRVGLSVLDRRLTAQTQTIAWMVIFFFASPAASAAYLTVSETFPLEVRALAIPVYAIAPVSAASSARSVRCLDRYGIRAPVFSPAICSGRH